MLNYKRYKRNPVVDFPERTWPNKEIEKAPIWCSVDLRDGNQALIEPMNVEEKMEMFELLLRLGFKEIEIGFPAASQIEYDFLRKLVKENNIPEQSSSIGNTSILFQIVGNRPNKAQQTVVHRVWALQ